MSTFAYFLFVGKGCPQVNLLKYREALSKRDELLKNDEEIPWRLSGLKKIPTEEELRAAVDNWKKFHRKTSAIFSTTNFIIQAGISITSENDTNKIITGLSALSTLAFYLFDIDNLRNDRTPRGINFSILPSKVGNNYIPAINFALSF